MRWKRISLFGKAILGASMAVVATAGMSRAADSEAELRAVIEQQHKQIEELKLRLGTPTVPVAVQPAAGKPVASHPVIGEDIVQKIATDYLQSCQAADEQTSEPAGQAFVIEWERKHRLSSTPSPVAGTASRWVGV
jgi:hypothetical protein